jgi:hypothetical protein
MRRREFIKLVGTPFALISAAAFLISPLSFFSEFSLEAASFAVIASIE